MRLSHIEIENFKGIGTKQSIDLAPITLLFGPNSAGKSTILQALHYLREILERNNPDPDQTIAGGLTDLGGFATLVHNHDLSRAIRIKVRIDMTEDQGSERLPLNSGASLRDDRFNELGIRYLVGENTELRDYAVVQEVGVGIEVRWSDLINAPFVSRVDIEMDGKSVCSIISPAQAGRAQLTDFNFQHPLLEGVRYPEDYFEELEELTARTVALRNEFEHREEAAAYEAKLNDRVEELRHVERQLEQYRAELVHSDKVQAEVDALMAQRKSLLAELNSLEDLRSEAEAAQKNRGDLQQDRHFLRAEEAKIIAQYQSISERLEKTEQLVHRSQTLRNEREELSDRVRMLRNEIRHLEEIRERVSDRLQSEAFPASNNLQRQDPLSAELVEAIWMYSREMNSVMEEMSEEEIEDATDSSAWDTDVRINIETEIGALPEIDKPLVSDLVQPDRDQTLRAAMAGRGAADRASDQMFGRFSRQTRKDEEAYESELKYYKQQLETVSGLTKLLDELALGPVRIVRDYLTSVTYIGPLREIPSRGYRPRLSPDESRWAQGLAAWDVLYAHAGEELLDSVNEWMSSEERLRTGYLLVKSDFKQISSTDGLHRLFQRGINDDDLGDLQELYEAIPTKTEIGLMDATRGILVAPSDVGVGISQMVPVVVACLMDAEGLVAIEQPELHIHPAIQVGMGDLFIQATMGPQPAVGAERTLLVETHSEHIMLRILRRIREQNDAELPPKTMGLVPADLSVVYVEATNEGPVFKKLEVDEDGEFTEPWPKGFFEERAEELF